MGLRALLAPLPTGAELLAAPSGGVAYLRIDAGWPPFDLQGVRQAVSVALDRRAIARAAGPGAAVGTDARAPGDDAERACRLASER